MAKTQRANRDKTQYGDFQTPQPLAERCCRVLHEKGLQPGSILEPTCGQGAFLAAAARQFPAAQRLFGLEINGEYVAQARQVVRESQTAGQPDIVCDDFFQFDWNKLLAQLPGPLLVLGNPPWVTNSGLSIIRSDNLPAKTNSRGARGIDAITGKSNFDISEWMIGECCRWLSGREGTLGMLCKTSVARKVLQHAWRNELQIVQSAIHSIDAQRHFGAAVDACLLLVEFSPGFLSQSCDVYSGLHHGQPNRTVGMCDGTLVSNLKDYQQLRNLRTSDGLKWRSGMKHDCSQVMQLRREDARLVNGFGEAIQIEPEYVFPLLKSSDLNGVGAPLPRYSVIVPQSFVGQATEPIRQTAPLTWNYLTKHGARLDRRSSSIYRGKPRFSVFGIGEYSFAPWKVAIAGMYKRLRFHVVGPHDGRPMLFDDTCYFLPFETRSQAQQVCGLLTAPAAQAFLSSLAFWDEKRPVTAELLSRIDLDVLESEAVQ